MFSPSLYVRHQYREIGTICGPSDLDCKNRDWRSYRPSCLWSRIFLYTVYFTPRNLFQNHLTRIRRTTKQATMMCLHSPQWFRHPPAMMWCSWHGGPIQALRERWPHFPIFDFGSQSSGVPCVAIPQVPSSRVSSIANQLPFLYLVFDRINRIDLMYFPIFRFLPPAHRGLPCCY